MGSGVRISLAAPLNIFNVLPIFDQSQPGNRGILKPRTRSGPGRIKFQAHSQHELFRVNEANVLNSHDPYRHHPSRLRGDSPNAPLGSVAYENEINENGERQIWLDRAVIDRLPFLRESGESYNDVILRLAESG